MGLPSPKHYMAAVYTRVWNSFQIAALPFSLQLSLVFLTVPHQKGCNSVVILYEIHRSIHSLLFISQFSFLLTDNTLEPIHKKPQVFSWSPVLFKQGPQRWQVQCRKSQVLTHFVWFWVDKTDLNHFSVLITSIHSWPQHSSQRAVPHREYHTESRVHVKAARWNVYS